MGFIDPYQQQLYAPHKSYEQEQIDMIKDALRETNQRIRALEQEVYALRHKGYD